jgi:LacI family transcriptional regulator
VCRLKPGRGFRRRRASWVTPFASPLIEGARDAAAAEGCIVAVFCTGGQPEAELAALEVLSATGLVGVLYTSLITRTVMPPQRLSQFPAVLLNCHEPHGHFPSVVPGDVTGGLGATEVMIRAGHRRIGHIQGEEWGEASRDRAKGYRQALTSADIAFDGRLLVGPAWTVDSGRDLTLHLLDLPDPPTGIFCFNDRAAIGAYEAAALRGLRVPEDLSIVGFDDEDFAANLLPPLTTMVLPHDEMARTAVQMLGHMRPEGAAARPRRIKIDCGLVQRGSVTASRGL